MSNSQEYLKREFLHHLSDTLLLLGASSKLVKSVRELSELKFTSDIVDELRKFNISQIEKIKDIISGLNKTTITP